MNLHLASVTRRRFCALGGTAAFLSAVPAWPLSTSEHANRSRTPDIIVYDRRYPMARAFARSAMQSGLVPVSTDGDVTELWRSELDPRLKRGRLIVAGLTTWPGFVCLAQMCRSNGMTGRFTGRHFVDGNAVSHRLAGSIPVVRHFSQGLAAGGEWQRAFLRAMMKEPVLGVPRTSVVIQSDRQSGDVAGSELVSWIIG